MCSVCSLLAASLLARVSCLPFGRHTACGCGEDFETMLSTDIADVGPMPGVFMTGPCSLSGSLCPILFLTEPWNPGLLQSSLNGSTELSTLDFLGARGCADRPQGQASRT